MNLTASLHLSLPVPQLSNKDVVDARLSYFGLSSDLLTVHYQDAIIFLFVIVASQVIILFIRKFLFDTFVFYLFHPKRSSTLAGQIMGVLLSFILPWSSFWDSPTAKWTDSINKGLSFSCFLFFAIFPFLYFSFSSFSLKRVKLETFLNNFANFIYPLLIVVKEIRIFFGVVCMLSICQMVVASGGKKRLIRKVTGAFFPLFFNCSFFSVVLNWGSDEDFLQA